MILRNNIDGVMDRTKRFNSNNKMGDALITINLKTNPYKIKGLNKWEFPKQMEEFLDENIKALEYSWSQREGVDDDSIPSLHPRYGIAEHSAFIAGDVDFSEDTSWPHPVINDYCNMDKLTLNKDNNWLKMVIDGLSYLEEKSQGRYAVKLRGAMSPLDVANALRGNDIFMDFYDYPEELHNLLEFCTQASAFYIQSQSDAVQQFYGGYISGGGIWLPGNSYGHLSEDTSVMCSADIYRQFGKDYTTKLVESYDNVYMHLHTAGVQAFKDITDIKKLSTFELAPDPNQPRGIKVYKDNFHLFNDSIMRIYVTFDEIKENIEFLKQAKTILHCNACCKEEANEIIDYVRRELPIK